MSLCDHQLSVVVANAVIELNPERHIYWIKLNIEQKSWLISGINKQMSLL